MTELVLDASVVFKWFRTADERGLAEARALRRSFEQGELLVLVPSLLQLEILNAAGRRWGWSGEELDELAGALDDLGFHLVDPELSRVAEWTARGLTAYDAAYVAVAENAAIELITDDERILQVADGVATPLVARGSQG